MNNPYLFYEVMQYPVPFQKEFFSYEDLINTVKSPEKMTISWAKPCSGLDEYVALIHKYEWLRKSIPYIDAIYLSGDITFNILEKDADIDLFIVTAPGRIWSTRILTVFLLRILGIKRTKKKKKMKFCVKFLVSRDALCLQSIKLLPRDPYLVYWLAHLIPLYQRLSEQPVDIYEANYRLRDYLPTFPMEQTVAIGTKLFTGSTHVKSWFEKVFGGILGGFIEGFIKFFTLPILLRKKKKQGISGESIILSDTILKFYTDRRKEYAIKWKVMNKK